MKRSLTVLFLVFTSVTIYAQQLEVKRVELNGDNVVFHYAIHDSIQGRTFSVNLYTSLDNFINPIEKISGDIGAQVKPGNDRKIVWNARQELGESFDGKVALEIRARIYIPLILFEGFEKIKRGKAREVTWRGGARQNTLNFDLYNKHDEKVTTVVANINAGSGHTSLSIPSDVKPGKGYRLKIIDSKNKDKFVESEPFTIKRKVPLLLIALPIAAVGGAAVLVGGMGGDDGPPQKDNIPDPQSPPGGG